MTVDQATREIGVRLDFDAHAPHFARAMSHLDQAATRELDQAGIETLLRELIRVRASQLNGCAYCVDMHTKDARAAGETEQRLYGLAAWRETPFFTDRERAALAFTESVTQLAATHVPDADFAAVAAEFSPAETGALVALLVAINAWNTIGVSTRAWEPGCQARVLTPIAFQALMVTMRLTSAPSSASLNTAAACAKSSSGTCVCAASVIDSVSASADRSRSVKNGVSCHAASAYRRCSVSPAARASLVCMSTQYAQPLSCDALVRISSRNRLSIPAWSSSLVAA